MPVYTYIGGIAKLDSLGYTLNINKKLWFKTLDNKKSIGVVFIEVQDWTVDLESSNQELRDELLGSITDIRGNIVNKW